MPTVELVYDAECPNILDARAELLRAFAQAKLQPRWQEWRADKTESPAHVRGFGSPTILVDGRDVARAERDDAACCRLYVQPDGSVRGVPSVEMIATALGGTGNGAAPVASESGAWKLNLAMLPGIGAAFLPKIACPACWPAYAGFLGSIGLGFLLDSIYLLPLTATFLVLAVGALAFRAKGRRGYRPLLVGLAAAPIVLIGNFVFESDAAMYTGLVLLIAASVWNTWPRRPSAECPACVGEDLETSPKGENNVG